MGGDAHSCAYCSLCYRCVWSMVLVLIGVQHMASKQCGFSGGEGGLDGSRCSWAATRARARTARYVWSMVLVLIGVQHMASKQCGFGGGEGGLDRRPLLAAFVRRVLCAAIAGFKGGGALECSSHVVDGCVPSAVARAAYAQPLLAAPDQGAQRGALGGIADVQGRRHACWLPCG